MNVQQDSQGNDTRKLLQWHPAFFAGIQIELKDEADNLIFEQEHPLGTKPMSIDVLIKKEEDISIRKNIGRIFRKYNILEYKGPGDYLSVDDFYKVYGYTCFYKADALGTDTIKVDELTISLISERFPKAMVRHLKKERGYNVKLMEDGIFYIEGDKIPIQLIVTSQLSDKENLWLRYLTNGIEGMEAVKQLLKDYKNNKKNRLYKSIMDVIVTANKENFKEVKNMCDALEELMKEELEAKKIEGKIEGESRGKDRVNALVLKLSAIGRTEDIVKAAADPEYQKQLFEEFGI